MKNFLRLKTTALFVLAMLMAFCSLSAQPTNGIMDPEFPIEVGTETFVPLGAGATTLTPTSTDDGYYTLGGIPFPINFDGLIYNTGTTWYFGTNLYLSFNYATGSIYSTPTFTPPTRPFIHLVTVDGGNIPTNGGWLKVQTLGAAPDRKFVIEIYGIHHYSTSYFTGVPGMAQIIFYENENYTDYPNHFRIHFGPWTSGTWSSMPSGAWAGIIGNSTTNNRLVHFLVNGTTLSTERSTTDDRSSKATINAANMGTGYMVPDRYIDFGDIVLVDHTVLEMTYIQSAAIQGGATKTLPGGKDVHILTAKVKFHGDLAPLIRINQLVFNAKTAVSTGKITKATLWYGGKNGTFDTNTAVKVSTLSTGGGGLTSDVMTFNFNNMVFPDHGNYYFFLTYDISRGTTAGMSVDASWTSMHLEDATGTTITINPPISPSDPAGQVNIITGGYVYCTPGGNPTPSTYTGTTSTGWPGYYYYNFASRVSRYKKAELEGLPGTINNVAYWVYTYGYSGNPPRDSVFILMKNFPAGAAESMPPGTVPAVYNSAGLAATPFPNYLNACINNGWTIVKGPFSFPNVSTTQYWLDVALDSPFDYEGGDLGVICCRFNLNEHYYYINQSTATYPNYWYPDGYDYGYYQYAYESSTPTANPTGTWYSYPYQGYESSYYYMYGKVKTRINIDYMPGMKFKSANGYQVTGLAGTGAQNVAVCGLSVEINGKDEFPYMYAKQFKFNGKASYGNQQITKAKLFYSHSDSNFSTAIQIGSTINVNAANISNLVFTSNDLVQLNLGKNYFWLSYTIDTSIAKTDGMRIDGAVIEATLAKIDSNYVTLQADTIFTTISDIITNKDPSGDRLILAPLSAGIYYVGSPANPTGKTYPTLAQLAQEFTQIGVTKDTKIVVISDLTDTALATFGPSPFGDNIRVTMEAKDGGAYTISNTNKDSLSAAINLAGIQNFTINGKVDNSDANPIHNKTLSLKKTTGGSPLRAVNVVNLNIKNVFFNNDVARADAKSNVTLDYGTNVTIDSCIFYGGNYGIDVRKQSTAVKITNNVFSNPDSIVASNEKTQLGNGVALLDGTINSEVQRNTFNPMKSVKGMSRAVYMAGKTSKQNLNNLIANNTICDIATSDTSSVTAFHFENASNVKLYHNSVIYDTNTTRTNRITTMIYNSTPGSVQIHAKNNLFSNRIVGPGMVSNFYITPTPSGFLASGSGYNVYNGNIAFCNTPTGTPQTSTLIGDWQATTGADMTSYKSSYTAYYTGYHIDGGLVGMPEMLVPVLPPSELFDTYDIDGLKRGEDAFFPDHTTPGADEAMLQAVLIDSMSRLPDTILRCEEEEKAVLVGIEIRFLSWKDNVQRKEHPAGTNVWKNVQGDTLKPENGFRTDYYPYLYVEKPNHKQTCNFYVETRCGYFTNRTDTCLLLVVKEPVFDLQPIDQSICINAGSFTIPTEIYGSFESVQWQKQLPNGGWVNLTNTPNHIVGANTENLTMYFDENEAESVVGKYRLQVTPYIGFCNITSNLNSSAAEVTVGYPLTAVTQSESMPREQMIEGICTGESVWFEAHVPAGAGDVTGYQWEKYDQFVGDYVAIPYQVNMSAATDTLRFYSLNPENAGLYRCRVLGIPSCSEGSYQLTEPVELNVNLAAGFVLLPNNLEVCLGTDTRFTSAVLEPAGSSFQNQYKWFKDGVEFIRYDDAGIPITVTSPDYAIYRTDTTYLRFPNVEYENLGRYSLRLIRLNCVGEIDTLFTPYVNLRAIEKPYIVSQSGVTKVIVGNKAALKVEANAPGEGVTLDYQWYRHYKNGSVVKLQDGGNLFGSKASSLTFTMVYQDNVNEQDTNAVNDYYYCVISNGCGTITSAPMTFKVAAELSIVSNPQDNFRCAGDMVTFSVAAMSTDVTQPIGYKWYKDGNALTNNTKYQGVNAYQLQVNSLDLSDAGDYSCEVFFINLDDDILHSSAASLSVEVPPTIVSITPDTNLPLGTELRLYVTVAYQPGAIYEYKWYKDGVPIPNSDYEVLVIDQVKNTDAGIYQVTIISVNGCGQITSNEINVNFISVAYDNNPDFRIISVVPNPMSNDATINYTMPQAQDVTITLVDINGKHILDIFSGYANADMNSVKLNGRLSNVSNGTYFIKMEAKGMVTIYKINVIK